MKNYKFQIPDESLMINFSAQERVLISKEAQEYNFLSDQDKENIKMGIQKVIDEYNPDKRRACDSAFVIPGGYDCEVLKKYISSIGLKYSPCGNHFDLWINCNVKDEQKNS